MKAFSDSGRGVVMMPSLDIDLDTVGGGLVMVSIMRGYGQQGKAGNYQRCRYL